MSKQVKNLVSYNFVDERWKVFERNDGTRVPLLPEPYCEKCADPIHPDYIGSGLCYNCYHGDTRVDGDNLSKVYAASISLKKPRKGPLSSLTNEIFENKKDASHAEEFAEILQFAMNEMYPDLYSFDLLLPTPAGRKTATFNHMKNVVKSLSSRVDKPYKNVLFKKTDYPSQRTLKKEERIENVKNNIGCREEVGGNIILVDDVYTTGATMLNSAKALKNMGAEKVIGLVISRASNKGHLAHIGALEKKE